MNKKQFIVVIPPGNISKSHRFLFHHMYCYPFVSQEDKNDFIDHYNDMFNKFGERFAIIKGEMVKGSFCKMVNFSAKRLPHELVVTKACRDYAEMEWIH